MVEIAEVVDRETLEAYLEEQPIEVAQAIAVRCVWRVLPALGKNNIKWDHGGSVTLEIFRFLLLSTVLTQIAARQNQRTILEYLKQIPERRITFSSNDPPISLIHSASIAAVKMFDDDSILAKELACRFSVQAAEFARINVSLIKDTRFWNEIQNDLSILFLDVGKSAGLLDQQLWLHGEPEDDRSLWRDLRYYLDFRNEGWEVWFPIYEGFRDEKPLNWDLLAKIALIPDEDWREDDPTYTNGLIAGIIADFAEAQTSHGEVIEADAQTGMLRAVPLESQNESYIETCVSAVEASVKRLLQSGGTNEYSGIADTLEILLEDIELDRGNAFSLFNAFSFALRRVQGAVESEIVPKLEQDARLGRLVEALDKGIADLSGSEYVQEGLANRRQFAAEKVADLITDDVVGYAQASSMISTESLKEELARDVAPRDTYETAEEKAAREVRLYGRLLRVRRYLKEGNLEKASALVLRKGDEVLTAVDAVNKLKDMAELLEWVLRLL